MYKRQLLGSSVPNGLNVPRGSHWKTTTTTFIQKCHLNNTRITRWILSIQEYNFEILHCKGKENIVADILSRHPEDNNRNVPTEDKHEYYIHAIEIKMNKNTATKLQNINQMQLANDKIKQIIIKIKERSEDQMSQHFKLMNNKLYRSCKNQWKLYIPKELRVELIQEIHQMYDTQGRK